MLPYSDMAKREMTVTEFARMGGKALASQRTKAERQDAARKAAKARWTKDKKTRDAA